MVVAHAALCNKVAIVLKHVEVVVADDAVDFGGEIAMDGGNAEVDGLAFELFGLPVGREIVDEPVWDFADVESAGLGVEASLGPIDPEAEAEALGVRCIGEGRQAVRKLEGVGVPVANAAEPAGVEVKHLQAEFS